MGQVLERTNGTGWPKGIKASSESHSGLVCGDSHMNLDDQGITGKAEPLWQPLNLKWSGSVKGRNYALFLTHLS